MKTDPTPDLGLWSQNMPCAMQTSAVVWRRAVVALTLAIVAVVAIIGITVTARRVLPFSPGAQVLPARASTAPDASSLVFSTYIGGSQDDPIRDVTTDAAGNIYITGGTLSPNFPTTPGAFQTSYGGWMDVFVAKFAPDGRLLWSTYIGGPEYDRAYGLEVDSQGYVYVSGRAGRGFPTTADAFQPTFQGFYTGSGYGNQNAFVCKLRTDGASLVFCSYIGPFPFMRDIDIDTAGSIYTAGPNNEPRQTHIAPAAWFANAFQSTSRGGSDLVVTKIASDGSRVEWASYFGGADEEGGAATIRVKDDDGTVYVFDQTSSTDLPVTASAYQRTNAGGWDSYLVRFVADGSDLIFATYLGGSGPEFLETHEMALDAAGTAYLTGATGSQDFPTTPGVLQRALRGQFDVPLAKISADGSRLLASTYLGGSGSDGVEGIQVDAQGNIDIFGATESPDFMVTSDAVQSQLGGARDAFVAKVAPDLNRILYASYLGGSGGDSGRAGWVDHAGSLIVAGVTRSDDWPLLEPIQSNSGGMGDGALAKITLASSVLTSTPTSTPSPRPTNTPMSTAVPGLTSTPTSSPQHAPIRCYLPVLLANSAPVASSGVQEPPAH